MIKLAIVCFLGVFALYQSLPIQTRSDEHNIYECIDPEVEKVLLFAEPVVEKGQFLQVLEKDLIFPSTGINSKRITCMSVQDRDSNGHGAYVKVMNGGVGAYTVQLHFQSQFNEGINFNVELYTDADTSSDDGSSSGSSDGST